MPGIFLQDRREEVKAVGVRGRWEEKGQRGRREERSENQVNKF